MDVPTRGLVGLPQGMVANVITATVGEMVVDEIQMSRAEARSPRKNIAAIEMTFFVYTNYQGTRPARWSPVDRNQVLVMLLCMNRITTAKFGCKFLCVANSLA